MKIEVFRNKPPGKSCKSLTAGVLEAVSEMTEDIEVKLLSFPSAEAERRGINKAPATIFNGKTTVLGVLSKEDIVHEIEELKKKKIGVVISKSPFYDENVKSTLTMMEGLIKNPYNEVTLFLVSDGVWMAKRGVKDFDPRLREFTSSGGKVILSQGHLKACGLKEEGLIDDVTITSRPYDDLVDLVMDEWDRTVVV